MYMFTIIYNVYVLYAYSLQIPKVHPCKTLRIWDSHWQAVELCWFVFTILEENSTGSVDGIHPLVLFCDPEKYESVKLALLDVIEELKMTKEITVCGETFRVIYSLGGDYKFLAMVTGIDSATCKYACI